jgi:citrate lyase beta subunit
MDRPRRSLLFAPGDDARKLAKAAQSNADCVILELEDGVALNRKAIARETVRDAAEMLDFGQRERLIRVNGVDTPFFEDDLRGTIDARPDGYVLPKVEGAADVQRLCRILDAAERERGWPAGGIGMIILVESPRGVLNLREICEADARLQAVIFGAEDYASLVGARRTREATEVLFARSAVVNACGAFGLRAIDMVFIDFNDDTGLEQECLRGRQLGFAGKQVIHPRQIDIVNRCFSPSESEIAWARRVVEGFRASQAEGHGAFALDGKMIDLPVVRQAERILRQEQGG